MSNISNSLELLSKSILEYQVNGHIGVEAIGHSINSLIINATRKSLPSSKGYTHGIFLIRLMDRIIFLSQKIIGTELEFFVKFNYISELLFLYEVFFNDQFKNREKSIFDFLTWIKREHNVNNEDLMIYHLWEYNKSILTTLNSFKVDVEQKSPN